MRPHYTRPIGVRLQAGDTIPITRKTETNGASVMTIGEICKGIATLPVSQRRERWGHLAAGAKRHGLTLAIVDGVIAATALHNGLTLVTRNVKDFAGLGIDVANPWNVKHLGAGVFLRLPVHSVPAFPS